MELKTVIFILNLNLGILIILSYGMIIIYIVINRNTINLVKTNKCFKIFFFLKKMLLPQYSIY